MSIDTAIDPRTLRTVLGKFATGVVVVTANTPDGTPVGMTMNSFTSVSLDPPLILCCVGRTSQLHPALTTADAFAVNVLRESQKDVSRQFARPGLERFGSLRPLRGASGAPLIEGALAVLECANERVIDAGDHDIVVGRVRKLDTTRDLPAEPLVYFAGGYRSLDTTHTDWWTAFG